ncbi:hypothetical protein EVA_15155 [gut metagenome]|uniref:Uncharacterized protein n=1 Tax=gut metagenome TaxID=749906 RepID=J9G4J5_9ZZZZ
MSVVFGFATDSYPLYTGVTPESVQALPRTLYPFSLSRSLDHAAHCLVRVK